MRMTNLINECITMYKIEQWNEKKECWEYYRGFISYETAKRNYKDVLDEVAKYKRNYKDVLECKKEIYRLIKVIEIDEK